MHRVPFAFAIAFAALQSALFFGCSAAPGASAFPDDAGTIGEFDGGACAPIRAPNALCADAGARAQLWACPSAETPATTCTPLPGDPAHPTAFTGYCCE